MSAYIDAGYVVALGTLAVYGSTLVARERAARRRIEAATRPTGEELADDDPSRVEAVPGPITDAR
ncbi:MAG TPA: hypothetical protein VKR27_06350 [Acidimicrobiales bacterium]|nr:hypothetical protein [Acidimicrobiales bacterium]